MSELIDPTNTPTTNSTREEWRARNKPPHPSKTPAELQQAREMALAIPPSLKQQLLPPLHLYIRDFIDRVLPEQCSFFDLVKCDTWFSEEQPNHGLECLGVRPVPAQQTLRKIEAAFTHQWLSGANSLVDLRYNDGRSRLPLYAVPFWWELAQVIDEQKMWREAWKWLETEEEKADPFTSALIEPMLAEVGSIGRHVPLRYLRGSATNCTSLWVAEATVRYG
ncbi:hypothetical protein BDN71DRAFT_760401 [Pleurotus eryngii]|uniref:Uncharacterized protein n=1 Tax=Pleurotus eryngii TaxID=5323 RepID=A0A9P5ZF73_PLEER|nr:hypothetical protein BDN71DRAFT_760401 [Pleurotus eryngii]